MQSQLVHCEYYRPPLFIQTHSISKIYKCSACTPNPRLCLLGVRDVISQTRFASFPRTVLLATSSSAFIIFSSVHYLGCETFNANLYRPGNHKISDVIFNGPMTELLLLFREIRDSVYYDSLDYDRKLIFTGQKNWDLDKKNKETGIETSIIENSRLET